MRLCLLSLVLAWVVSGCGRTTPTPNITAPTPINTATEVPDHEARATLLGVWRSDERPVLQISEEAPGRVMIVHLSTEEEAEVWRNVIDNAHWEGDALWFDQYYYYIGDQDLTWPGNPDGGHPFSGVRNQMSLVATDDPTVLLYAYTDLSMPAELREPERLTRVRPDE